MKNLLKTILLYVKLAASQLATLSNPVADAALAALVVKLLPFIHVSTSRLVDYAAAVGIVATYVKTRLSGLNDNVAKAKAARSK